MADDGSRMVLESHTELSTHPPAHHWNSKNERKISRMKVTRIIEAARRWLDVAGKLGKTVKSGVEIKREIRKLSSIRGSWVTYEFDVQEKLMSWVINRESYEKGKFFWRLALGKQKLDGELCTVRRRTLSNVEEGGYRRAKVDVSFVTVDRVHGSEQLIRNVVTRGEGFSSHSNGESAVHEMKFRLRFFPLFE